MAIKKRGGETPGVGRGHHPRLFILLPYLESLGVRTARYIAARATKT